MKSSPVNPALANWTQIFASFAEQRVLVVGDVMLDQYYRGTVRRISPEAPVPVVHVQRTEYGLGGAANVAANVRGLRAECTLIGSAGRDDASARLVERLDAAGIRHQLVPSARPTITKVRVIGEHQQMVRLDFEDVAPPEPEQEDALIAAFERELPSATVVVLSDYGKGVCTERVTRALIQRCREQDKAVLVDPKTRDWSRYRGATFVTPNLKEYQEVLGLTLPNTDASIEAHAAELLDRYELTGLVVTRSEQGMSLTTREGNLHIRTEAQEVFDVSGAGDTFIGTFSVGLAAGAAPDAAARLANAAAGVVVARVGTVPITFGDLNAALRSDLVSRKVLDTEALLEALSLIRARGHRVVFTNGCFDLVHRGHLQYLRKARSLGDCLVVGLNSDSSVRELKGPDRPIHSEQDRALLLASLEYVDFVCLFEESTPVRLLSQVRPDILVKGADYQLEEVLGREYAEQVVLIDFVPGYSTTSLLDRLGHTPSGQS